MEQGNRVFGSVLDGMQALLFNVALRVQGQQPRASPTPKHADFAEAFKQPRAAADGGIVRGTTGAGALLAMKEILGAPLVKTKLASAIYRAGVAKGAAPSMAGANAGVVAYLSALGRAAKQSDQQATK